MTDDSAAADLRIMADVNCAAGSVTVQSAAGVDDDDDDDEFRFSSQFCNIMIKTPRNGKNESFCVEQIK